MGFVEAEMGCYWSVAVVYWG